MAKLVVGALLLAANLVSFQLGATLGDDPMPVPHDDAAAAAHSADGALEDRVVRLEQRLDALAARETAQPTMFAPAAVEGTARREVAAPEAPLLSEAVAALRDAVLRIGSPAHAYTASPARRQYTDVAAVQTILANAPGPGTIEDSDLLMLTVPQLLERLGRPTTTWNPGSGRLGMVFRTPQGALNVAVQDGYVVRVSVAQGS